MKPTIHFSVLLLACGVHTSHSLCFFAVARRLKKKRKKRRRRSFTKMDEWLVCSMTDNNTFEWIDVLTGDVLTGDGSVQRSQPAHVARSTALWRVPI